MRKPFSDEKSAAEAFRIHKADGHSFVGSFHTSWWMRMRKTDASRLIEFIVVFFCRSLSLIWSSLSSVLMQETLRSSQGKVIAFQTRRNSFGSEASTRNYDGGEESFTRRSIRGSEICNLSFLHANGWEWSSSWVSWWFWGFYSLTLDRSFIKSFFQSFLLSFKFGDLPKAPQRVKVWLPLEKWKIYNWIFGISFRGSFERWKLRFKLWKHNPFWEIFPSRLSFHACESF